MQFLRWLLKSKTPPCADEGTNTDDTFSDIGMELLTDDHDYVVLKKSQIEPRSSISDGILPPHFDDIGGDQIIESEEMYGGECPRDLVLTGRPVCISNGQGEALTAGEAYTPGYSSVYRRLEDAMDSMASMTEVNNVQNDDALTSNFLRAWNDFKLESRMMQVAEDTWRDTVEADSKTIRYSTCGEDFASLPASARMYESLRQYSLLNPSEKEQLGPQAPPGFAEAFSDHITIRRAKKLAAVIYRNKHDHYVSWVCEYEDSRCNAPSRADVMKLSRFP